VKRIPRAAMFGYQNTIVERIESTKEQAAFVNMGLGKTISALTAMLDLDSFPALVVAPARVVRHVWAQEAARWVHTAGLRVVTLDGSPERRRAALGKKAEIYVISYDNLIWLMEEIDCNTFFRAVVWDELSKMKHAGARRFKLARGRMADIPVRIGLTGTPIGNHLIDLWGEMFMVAGEKPLGGSKVGFAMTYFTAIPVDEHAKLWMPNHGAAELIFEKVKPWCFSLEPKDAPALPEVTVNVIEVGLPKAVRDMADELGRELRIELASGSELIALSSGTRAQKVRQMAGGAVYLTPGGPWEPVHEEKLDALEDVLDELQGEPALCFYWYKHERERILARFPQAVAFTDDCVDRWNNREIELLLLHPASAGHGLNLQFGGHNIVWYTLPWSLEMWQQSNGRLPRPGQRSPFIAAHVLVAGDADLAVLQALRSKDETQRMLIETVRIS
jgi:hypothetical protein